MKKLLTILVKDPKKSKSRLSCVLSLKERIMLTKMMLLDILRKIDFSFFDEIPQYKFRRSGKAGSGDCGGGDS